MEENKEVKKKYRAPRGRIAGKVIAAIIAAFMLLASCSTIIFYFVYNA